MGHISLIVGDAPYNGMGVYDAAAASTDPILQEHRVTSSDSK